MLEANRFVVSQRMYWFRQALTYTIHGPDGPLGTAEETLSRAGVVAHWLGLGRVCESVVEVYEGPDSSHVFTVLRRPYWFRRRAEVYDAPGELVGTLTYTRQPARTGDGGHSPDVVVRRCGDGYRHKVLSRDGRRLSGTVRVGATATRWWKPSGLSYTVETATAIDTRPLAKMLVLAAVFLDRATTLDCELPAAR